MLIPQQVGERLGTRLQAVAEFYMQNIGAVVNDLFSHLYTWKCRKSIIIQDYTEHQMVPSLMVKILLPDIGLKFSCPYPGHMEVHSMHI